MSVEVYDRDGTHAYWSKRRYPGGEFLIDVEVASGAEQFALVRGAIPDDLVALAVWANSVRRLGGIPVGLVPYLPGARADHSDRAVGFDAPVYASLINAMELERVVCVDPHSPVMPAMIDRCWTIAAADLVCSIELPADLVGLIAPDEGASDRVGRVAERLGLPVFQARKNRDFDTGILSGFTCEPLPDDGSFLVVDDICDGGGTFRGLAAAVGVGRDRLHLWVSHGIFSGRAHTLLEDYSTITTTDSHPGCRNIPEARVIDLLPHLLRRVTA